MARLESVAVGGYYPTPDHLIPRIARLLSDPGTRGLSFLDPCAGDGAAVLGLIRAVLGGDGWVSRSSLYACEMEKGRHDALKERCESFAWSLGREVKHGDAFRLTFRPGYKKGVSCLFLNPPYDLDPVHGRLEERFLSRFTGTLAPSGVLVFLVPYGALKASAVTLAREYTSLRCYRFPADDFEAYKQVVLVAVRRGDSLLAPDHETLALVEGWARDPDSIPELPVDGDNPTPIPSGDYNGSGLEEWDLRPIDIKTLYSKVRPWYQTIRSGQIVPVTGVVPDMPVADLLLRKYPVAMPPRPAHIAAGIASGIFNGARIEPSDPSTGLPPLLVKGVFDREFRTIEQKEAKDGTVKAIVQVQQPKLVTTVLDLNTHKYHVLKSGTNSHGTPDIESMTVADLLAHYGTSLMSVMERQCPITYDPRRDAEDIPLASSPRRLFSAQAHAARALVRLLGGPTASAAKRRGKSAILLGEIGSGKSTVSITAARSIGAERILVLCPPHLLTSWQNEIAAVAPGMEVRVLQSVSDLHLIDAQIQAGTARPFVAILSRETAKLGHGWEGVTTACPRCGSDVPAGVDHAKKRSRCGYRPYRLASPEAEVAFRLATILQRHAPMDSNITSLLSNRAGRARQRAYLARDPDVEVQWPGLPTEIVEEALNLFVRRFIDGNGDTDKLSRAIVWTLVTAYSPERVITTIRRLMEPEDTGYSKLRDLARDLVLLLPPGSSEQDAIIDEVRNAPKRFTYAYHWNPWDGVRDRIRVLSEGLAVDNYLSCGSLAFADGAPVVAGHLANTVKAAREMLSCLCGLGHFPTGAACGEPLFQAVSSPARLPLARVISKRYPRMFDSLILDECFVAGTKVSGRPIETIRVGDEVDSYDEQTKTFVRRRVTRLWKNPARALVRVFFGGRSFVCTPNHPLLTESGWVTADRSIGKELVAHAARPRVDRIEVLERGGDGTFGRVCPDGFVYNLEVEGTHTYIAEGVVVHNCHEYATDGSAQERSAHRLTSLGIPTIMMTGTIMNGYAESLFTNFWALSPSFRSEFARDERQRFVDRYGYRKQLVEDKDKETGKVVEFGAYTDRVERQERFIGNAPGVLPLFLLRHLLPMSVTLHKTDLAIDLPPCRQQRHLIAADETTMSEYRTLQRAILDAIRKDQFEEGLAGKLFGQLAELPSYLDRATDDVGNCDNGQFEVRYPESVGGALVATGKTLPRTTTLAKEEWMLRTIETELAEGRNVMVFAWHVSLLPRLARLISERIGEPVPVLHADKVGTAKRQDWIDREVVRKKRRVLVTNPVAIQTGLNNLVHFATEVWMQNPACNPVIFRQAIGRVDRIGQKVETRIHVPVYVDTLQEQLHDLLMHKVAVSVSTDGLDPEAALQAAGVAEDDYLAGLSIGKQIYAMLTEGSAHERTRDEEIFRVSKAQAKTRHAPSDVMSMIEMIEGGA